MKYYLHYIIGYIQSVFNNSLDKVVSPLTVIGKKAWNSYSLWIFLGAIIGTIAVLIIASMKNISLPIISGLILMIGLLSFFIFKGTSIFGEQYSVLSWAKKSVYHFQIVALLFTITFLRVLKEPILAYLDILVIALLIYQAFGRIGCLMAGCCHGRPHNWGVCYGKKYAATGYPYFNTHVRLLPVQLFESVWLFALTFVAISIIQKPNPPGENLSLYIVGYGFGRFFFDFLRGNLNRVYKWGFSEAQWTALLLSSIIIGLELMQVIEFHWWHMFVVVIMIVNILVLSLMKRFQKMTKQQILQPDHILEVFQILNWISYRVSLFHENKSSSSKAELAFSGLTSLGIQIGLLKNPDAKHYSYQYQLSQVQGHLAKKDVTILAKMIVRLKHSSATYSVLEKESGIFHLLIKNDEKDSWLPVNTYNNMNEQTTLSDIRKQ